MAKAKKLPSGSWRVQYAIGGKVYSVTSDTQKGAELLAIQAQITGKRQNKPNVLTLDTAIINYIESKSNILSPSTISGYETIRRTAIPQIIDLPISRLDQKKLQQQFNSNAAHYSAKSISNQWGLVAAVLKMHNIRIDNVALKPKSKVTYNIPSPEQLKQIIIAIDGTGDLELFVLCMMTLGMRNSEVVALDWTNYDGQRLHVRGAVVMGANNQYFYRDINKTYDSNRILTVPDILKFKLDAVRQPKGLLFTKTSTAYYKWFVRVLEHNELPHFKLYDLRHAYASLMLMLGVPDKYAMEMMGHSTTNMLKTVYQHTFDNKKTAVSNQLNDFFNQLKEKVEE